MRYSVKDLPTENGYYRDCVGDIWWLLDGKWRYIDDGGRWQTYSDGKPLYWMPLEPTTYEFEDDMVNHPTGVNSFNDNVDSVLSSIGAILKRKNAAYGNSALDPVRVFSKTDTSEQLKVRIDDKLSRIKRGHDAGEDTILDLIGYLVLLKISIAGSRDARTTCS